MRERKYVPFDRITSIAGGLNTEKDSVAIGVLYEKAIPKVSVAGCRYTLWHLTDLAFPRPHILALFLHGEACEVWGTEAETPVLHSSVVALLNPTPLPAQTPSTARGTEEGRTSARISYSTQLVVLGECPSLGYCSWNKKDGLKCSMPCDRDRGPPICFFHTQQKCANRGVYAKAASFSGECKPGYDGKRKPPSDTYAVLEGPVASGQGMPDKAKQLNPQPLVGGAHGIQQVLNKGDLAVRRLLMQKPSKPVNARCNSKSITNEQVRPPMTPGLYPEKPRCQGALEATATYHKPGISESPQPARRTQCASPMDGNAAVIQRLLAKFPQGIPEPTQGRSCLFHQVPVKPQVMGLKTPPTVPTPVKTGACSSKAGALRCSVKLKLKQKQAKQTRQDKLEPQLALLKADPRKDFVRHQHSRFAGLVEHEKSAKRHRMLAEFEAQDAALEKMEAVMTISVVAWKCVECALTSDSARLRSDCQARQHTLTTCTVAKTRWECIGCKVSITVLDRVLPDKCNACGGRGWRQTPLQGKPKSAPMERDMLLPRGEELKFLNSIPGLPSGRGRSHREVDDPYDVLNHSLAG